MTEWGGMLECQVCGRLITDTPCDRVTERPHHTGECCRIMRQVEIAMNALARVVGVEW